MLLTAATCIVAAVIASLFVFLRSVLVSSATSSRISDFAVFGPPKKRHTDHLAPTEASSSSSTTTTKTKSRQAHKAVHNSDGVIINNEHLQTPSIRHTPPSQHDNSNSASGSSFNETITRARVRHWSNKNDNDNDDSDAPIASSSIYPETTETTGTTGQLTMSQQKPSTTTTTTSRAMLPPPRPPPAASSWLSSSMLRVPPSGGSAASMLPNRNQLLAPTNTATKRSLPQQQQAQGLLSPNAAIASSAPRQKVVLQPGHSPLDWATLTRSGKNLTGVERLQRVTPAQLAHHNGRKGRPAWSSWQGKVYNITPYLPFHPGGEDQLRRAAGKSADKLFMEVHPWVNWENMLGECCVGILVPDEKLQHQQQQRGAAASSLEDMD